MSIADRIREHVLRNYAEPAKESGDREFTVRAGDVHRGMGLKNSMPNVCSAIGSSKFLAMTGVTLKERTGPRAGANVFFRFSFDDGEASKRLGESAVSRAVRSTGVMRSRYELSNALILVSCVKCKQGSPTPARELYTSPWFRGVRELVESQGAEWRILSARHGLVDPGDVIAPYERTLKAMNAVEKRRWADEVLLQLLPLASGYERVVIFAGEDYRELLVEPLVEQGLEVDVPMAGLRQGEQLSWLSRGA